MNIFERLYNKVFHNETLIKENELEGEMFSKLKDLSKNSKLSAFQKAEEMVNCVEKYLGEIVKNRGNLWTGRNKVSKFLSNIRKKGSIEDKVSYLAGITKDKKFGGSYWAQKIGPIFSETENANMVDVFKRLESLGLIWRDSDFSFFIMGFNTARGMIFKFGDEGLSKIYDSEFLIRNVDSYVLYLFCLICKELESLLSGKDVNIVNCYKIRSSEKVESQDIVDLKDIIDYFQDKRNYILDKMCSVSKENFIKENRELDILSMMYGFYSQGSKKMKKIVEESWKKVASGI